MVFRTAPQQGLFVLSLILLGPFIDLNKKGHTTRNVIFFANAQDEETSGRNSSTSETEEETKAFKICSIGGGAAVAREASRSIQTLFLNALEDVEYMRELITETMAHNEDKLNLITVDDLANSLDWEARGFPEGTTTLEAGLAYTDDRFDRRVDRIVGLKDEPLAGDKNSDLGIVDILSGTLPWIVDRRSKEAYWWKEHQSGRSEGDATPELFFNQLYLAAYAVTWGNAASYYPPLSAFVPRGFTLTDILGENFSFRNDSSVYPTLPENNPERLAVIGTPYADRANPGLSIVSALAPLYYTGSWYGFEYNNTNLGLTAIDISINSISALLHRLDGTVTQGSFGLLVDGDFNVYVITQETVNKIYPERTGFEESRVHRDEAGFGDIIDDRRNQTYLVSDTILQPPTNLTNADWMALHEEISKQAPGYRGTTEIDIILTGDEEPTPHYVMYDKWTNVGDFTLLVFAPKEEVDTAIDSGFDDDEIELEALVGKEVTGEVVFRNNGILDNTVTLTGAPSWIRFDAPIEIGTKVHLASGDELVLPFTTATDDLSVGLTSSLLHLLVQDDEYPDCFYKLVHSATISIKVQREEDLQQLNSFRIFGFTISGLIMMTSIICSSWVMLQSENAIVKAAQPIFLHILSFGTFVMGLSIIPLSIDDSLATSGVCDVACNVFPWTFALGFSIAFSAVFSKVWRIRRLMTAASSMHRRKITAQDVMMPLCVVCTLNIVFLLALTLVDPLEWSRVEQSESLSYGTCWANLSGVQIAMLSLLAIVNLSALLLANIQAYLARDISDEFSESKYIFLANFGMLQVSMIGIPVLFLVSESPRALFFVQSTLVFAIAWPLQLLIFVPKLYFVKTNKNGDARQAVAAAVRKSENAMRCSKLRGKQAWSGSFRDFGSSALPPSSGADASVPSQPGNNNRSHISTKMTNDTESGVDRHSADHGGNESFVAVADTSTTVRVDDIESSSRAVPEMAQSQENDSQRKLVRMDMSGSVSEESIS